MTISLGICSDLHLDFNYPDTKQMLVDADYLFIAGDTIEAKWFEFAMNPNSGNHGEAQQLVHFFRKLSDHYKEVHVIAGNHEHYHGNLQQTHEIMEDFFKLFKMDNVLVHENVLFTLEGKTVYAGTGWTDMGGPNNYWFVKQGMNDFRLIRTAGYRKFAPEDAALIHAEFLNHLQYCQPDIILMHHAPSLMSIQPRFKDDPITGAYWSKAMERMLGNWTEPLTIVHGHTHYPVDYNLYDANIRVVSNPRGYDHNEQFSVQIIEV